MSRELNQYRESLTKKLLEHEVFVETFFPPTLPDREIKIRKFLIDKAMQEISEELQKEKDSLCDKHKDSLCDKHKVIMAFVSEDSPYRSKTGPDGSKIGPACKIYESLRLRSSEQIRDELVRLISKKALSLCQVEVNSKEIPGVYLNEINKLLTHVKFAESHKGSDNE